MDFVGLQWRLAIELYILRLKCRFWGVDRFKGREAAPLKVHKCAGFSSACSKDWCRWGEGLLEVFLLILVSSTPQSIETHG
jgi:hypothetical protein